MTYWKIVRWGGTTAVILVLAFAVLVSNSGPNSSPASKSRGEQGLRIN